MSSSISHKIKNRTVAKDVFITPKVLSKIHIDSIDYKDTDLWLDPCKNSGSYYNQFPTENKDSCEILEGKDFFEYKGRPDIIIQNPPYSILDKWIKKNIELNPRVISMLIGIGNLTTRRMEWLENAGYGLTKMKMLKVYSWYGMSMIVNFEKGKESIIEFDRTIYREDKEEEKEEVKEEEKEEVKEEVKEKPKKKKNKKKKKLIIKKKKEEVESPPPPYEEEEPDITYETFVGFYNDKVMLFEYDGDKYDYSDELYWKKDNYEYKWINLVIKEYKLEFGYNYWFDYKCNTDNAFKLWIKDSIKPEILADFKICSDGHLWKRKLTPNYKEDTYCPYDVKMIKVKSNLF